MSSHFHVLSHEQLVNRPRPEVFAFFADAKNLEVLTPPSLRFRILSPLPIEMRAGALIEYKLHLFGVPFRWKTLIESFEPEERFIDVQLSGPYQSWRHTHEFESVPEGTLVRDRVEYQLPFGVAGELARTLFIRRILSDIFEFRRTTIARLFESAGES